MSSWLDATAILSPGQYSGADCGSALRRDGRAKQRGNRQGGGLVGAAPHTGRACGAAGLSFLDNQAAQTDQASLASRAMELRRCRGTHLDALRELHPPGIGRCRPSEAVCVADLAKRSAWGLGTGVPGRRPIQPNPSCPSLFSVEKTGGAVLPIQRLHLKGVSHLHGQKK